MNINVTLAPNFHFPFLKAGLLIAVGCIMACSRSYKTYNYYSMQKNRTLIVGGQATVFPDDPDFETNSGVTDSTLHLEIIHPPFLVEAYSHSFPSVGDSATFSLLDIHDGTAAGSADFAGTKSGKLNGIPFAVSDSLFYAKMKDAVQGSVLEWRKAVRYEIRWDGKSLSGECHIFRFSHYENGNLGFIKPLPLFRVDKENARLVVGAVGLHPD